ncbi:MULTISPECIES: quinone-dependent dihydroorotate dehydrogenase [Corynebacterium]|uniref:quinone-dependent dihydroorotate dehydrogenase n=1 Tax=Corynebacterium TaxID=1716 RepID=UPI00124DE32A|nr:MULTISPECIES: quinone-dependent dihydroorotate dehydrogenase [Corynebacterium]
MASSSFRSTLYNKALKAMFTLRPERIHGIINNGLSVLQTTGPLNRGLEKILPVHDEILAQDIFGVRFPRPLGLAAGFDKNGSSPDAWTPIGFGYAELGTVTASPQAGNPTPRLFRLPEDRAILNRMGFNNDGAAAVAKNLKRRRSDDVIGINIGKTKVVDAAHAASDYRRSATLLGNLADYVTVNVSSPNTPGLRDLQAVESLRPILEAVLESTTTPVLVKIAPDLSDEDVLAVADLALELKLAGIVATNTTISREGLRTDPAEVETMGAGGISGPPVAARSLEVLRLLREHVGDQLVLVSVGGIETPEQAWERIAAGASLLQGYTGLIYGGPDWIRDIHKGIAHQVRAHGFSSLSQAVGCGKAWVD